MAVVLLLETAFYIIATRIILAYYKSIVTQLNCVNKVSYFRIFDKSFISNYPSSTGKKYFLMHNKFTIAFNLLFTLTFLVFILLVFKG